MLPDHAAGHPAGAALAFARAIGEFGSVVLMSGNIPFSTEVASVHIFAQVESDDPDGAAAVSVVLLLDLALGSCRRSAPSSGGGPRHDRE